MQYLHNIKGFAVGAVGFACFAGSVFYPPVAQAFPFQKNEQSFTSYLNSQVKWKDRMRRVFSNVYDCKFQDPGQGPPEGAWFNDQLALCNGYMTTYSPQGVKVCFVQGIEWSQEMFPTRQNSSLRTRYVSNCVWK